MDAPPVASARGLFGALSSFNRRYGTMRAQAVRSMSRLAAQASRSSSSSAGMIPGPAPSGPSGAGRLAHTRSSTRTLTGRIAPCYRTT